MQDKEFVRSVGLVRSVGRKCSKGATHFYLEPSDGSKLDLGVGLYAVCDEHAEELYDSFQKGSMLLTEEEFEVAIVMEA